MTGLEHVEFGQAQSPTWRRRQWRYGSPQVQVLVLGLVCFCLPGMFSALDGLGAHGKADDTIANHSKTALSVAFAVSSLWAGAIFNLIGHQAMILLGGLCYVMYVGSYLSDNAAFVISMGAVLGIGAGWLWAAQGAIMISYPEENEKGKYIGMFWGVFNSGAALGSIIPLIITWHHGKFSVSTGTYIGFMLVMGMGSIGSLFLLPVGWVIRDTGEPVCPSHYSSLTEEVVGILLLFADWRMLALTPMFLASNWFYTYQFNCLNAGGIFTTRTGAMNGTLYWVAQILGSIVMGNLLDSRRLLSKSRRIRALVGLTVLLVLSMVIWGGDLPFQLTFTRESVAKLTESNRIDFGDGHQLAGPMTLYSLFGLFDAVWQTYCYWIMGALTNDAREAARYAGYYKAIQNVGAALARCVDANKASFLNELFINWALITLGCMLAYPVAHYVTETSYYEIKEDTEANSKNVKLDESKRGRISTDFELNLKALEDRLNRIGKESRSLTPATFEIDSKT